MSGYWEIPNDYAVEPQTSHGSAHSVSSERPDNDPADDVRKIAEDITGKNLKKPTRPIGF